MKHCVEGTDKFAIVLHELEIREGDVGDFADAVIDGLPFLIEISGLEQRETHGMVLSEVGQIEEGDDG
jgi:hypothetical protein